MSSQFIWTNHATQRLRERKIPQSYIERTLSQPDKTIHKADGTQELQKRIDGRNFAAIIKPVEDDNMIILSLWANPPFAGTKDFRRKNRYQQMQRAKGFKKFLYAVLYQLDI